MSIARPAPGPKPVSCTSTRVATLAKERYFSPRDKNMEWNVGNDVAFNRVASLRRLSY